MHPRLWSAHIRACDNTRIVSLTGELDLSSADDLHHLLVTELDAAGVTSVTADLTGVTFLDSAALGALIRAYHHADDTGQHFYARNPTRAVHRVLDITGVHDILNPPSENIK